MAVPALLPLGMLLFLASRGPTRDPSKSCQGCGSLAVGVGLGGRSSNTPGAFTTVSFSRSSEGCTSKMEVPAGPALVGVLLLRGRHPASRRGLTGHLFV